MSSLDTAINRREALRRAALLLGGVISAPTLAGMLAGCESPAGGEAGWAPRALSGEQSTLVATLAEQIIPETDTPGARSAGVHRFIDTMLAEYYAPEDRTAFLAGLADVDARARSAGAASFVAAPAATQHDILTKLDEEAYRHAPAGAAASPAPDPERGTEGATADQRKRDTVRTSSHARRAPFFRTLKELTLLGYYTSEVGATKELHHAPVPGRFDGCVPLAKVGRAWAV